MGKVIFLTIFIHLGFQTKLYANENEIWRWSIGTNNYNLKLSQDSLVYQAEFSFEKISRKACSEELIQNFLKNFKKDLFLYQSPKIKLPNQIILDAPNFGKLQILPSSEIGKKIIGIKLELQKLNLWTQTKCLKMK